MVVALRVIDECTFVIRACLAIFLVQVAISEATAITVVTDSFSLLAIVTLRIILLLKACIDD